MFVHICASRKKIEKNGVQHLVPIEYVWRPSMWQSSWCWDLERTILCLTLRLRPRFRKGCFPSIFWITTPISLSSDSESEPGHSMVGKGWTGTSMQILLACSYKASIPRKTASVGPAGGPWHRFRASLAGSNIMVNSRRFVLLETCSWGGIWSSFMVIMMWWNRCEKRMA